MMVEILVSEETKMILDFLSEGKGYDETIKKLAKYMENNND